MFTREPHGRSGVWLQERPNILFIYRVIKCCEVTTCFSEGGGGGARYVVMLCSGVVTWWRGGECRGDWWNTCGLD